MREDRLELLETIKTILDNADSNLSWGWLPNQARIQDALNHINTLIALDIKAANEE